MAKLFSVTGNNPALGSTVAAFLYASVIADSFNEAAEKFIEKNPLFIDNISVAEVSKVIW